MVVGVGGRKSQPGGPTGEGGPTDQGDPTDQGGPPDQGGRYGLLATATTVNFAQFGARVVLSPFVLAIAGVFAVTKVEVGAALTGMWAAFALMQFPGGVLADKYGEKPVVVLSMALTVLGSLLVATAPSFPVFVLAVVALGVGAGLYFVVGTALLARRVRNRGRAFGVHSAGGPLAGLVVPVVATAVAARYDWRAGVAVGGLTAAGALLLVIGVVGETPPTAPDLNLRRRIHPRSVPARFARPGVAFTTVLAILGMYTLQSFISFFPAFLQEYHGFTQGQASFAFAVAFAVVVVGLPLVGSIADAYGTAIGLAGPFVLTFLGFVVLLLASGPALVYAGVCVVGAGLTWGGPLQSRFVAQFGAAERASGFGMARSVYVFVGSVGNVATGTLADVSGWVIAYGVVAVLGIVAALLVIGNEVGPSMEFESVSR